MKLYQFIGENRSFFITEFGHSSRQENVCIGTRVRNDYLLHFVIAGKCMFCDEEAVNTNVFFIPKGIPHHFSVSAGYEHYWIGFGGEEVPSFLELLRINYCCKIYEVFEYEKVKEQVQILFEQCAGKEGAEKLIIAFLLSALSLLNGNDEEGAAKARAKSAKTGYCEKAVRFMEQNLYRKLRVTEIAAYLSVSEKHFTRIFREEYGVPPQKYMIDMRINEAKKLLRETNLLVGEVAASVGYASLLEFSKIFKLYTGMSPSDFRAAQMTVG